MSIKMMVQVLYNDHPLLQDKSNLLVMLALADHANDDGICWPSIPRIAKLARLSERHTNRVLAKLTGDDVGFVEIVEPGGGTGKPNVYRLRPPRSGWHDDDDGGDRPPSPPVKPDRKPAAKTNGDRLSPIETNGDMLSSPNRDTASPLNHDTASRFGASNPDIRASNPDIWASNPDIAMSPDPPIEPSLGDPVGFSFSGKRLAQSDLAEDAADAWAETMAEAEQTFQRVVFDQWIRGATLQPDGDGFAVHLPSGDGRSWVEANALKWFQRTFRIVYGQPAALRIA